MTTPPLFLNLGYPPGVGEVLFCLKDSISSQPNTASSLEAIGSLNQTPSILWRGCYLVLC